MDKPTNQMIVYEGQNQPGPLTAGHIRAGVNLIREVMNEVMQKGEHYGPIPGCGPKPTLLKAGAEKLLSTFRIAVDPQIEDIPAGRHRRYRVVARGVTPQGVFIGSGIGEASTEEDKYAWRGEMSSQEFKDTDPSLRRTKYLRGGGSVGQIATNPADVSNTVLKMAKKRAIVDLCLTALAASDIFTQDIEDLPAEILNRPVEVKPSHAPAPQVIVETSPPPQPYPQPAPAPAPEPPQKPKLAEAVKAMVQKPAEQKPFEQLPGCVSEKQVGRFFALAKKGGWDIMELRSYLQERYGVEHSNQMRKADYDAICKLAEMGPSVLAQEPDAVEDDIPFGEPSFDGWNG